MILIYCPICEKEELVSASSVKSVHSTDRGILGLVDCYESHTLIHNFTTGKTLGTQEELETIVGAARPWTEHLAS